MPIDPDAIRYNDWDIAENHCELVRSVMPAGHRQPQLFRQIPGFVNGRITDGFRAGTFLMPMKSRIVRTYSSRHDVARSTLLIFAVGTTTTQATKTPDSFVLAEKLRTLFADRRIMSIPGELLSTHSDPEYDVDDNAARSYEFIVMILTSTIREKR